MEAHPLSVQFGRTYALAVIANDPPVVPPRIVSKVAIYVPPKELVDAYLEEISRGYGLAWRAPVSLSEGKTDAADDEDQGPDGGVGVKVSSRLEGWLL
jgi:vacuolar protein sorting-associated protein IST1